MPRDSVNISQIIKNYQYFVIKYRNKVFFNSIYKQKLVDMPFVFTSYFVKHCRKLKKMFVFINFIDLTSRYINVPLFYESSWLATYMFQSFFYFKNEESNFKKCKEKNANRNLSIWPFLVGLIWRQPGFEPQYLRIIFFFIRRNRRSDSRAERNNCSRTTQYRRQLW